MDDSHGSLTSKNVIEEQEKDMWCEELLKALEDEIVSVFIKSDANQCVLIEGVIYHKDKHKNSLDGQLQLVIPEVFRR